QLGAKATSVPTDVTDANAVKRLAAAAIQFAGRIDVWINNTGAGAVGIYTETPLESHEQVIKINLLGYMYGAHAILPHFIKQEAGTLINTLSLGSWVPQPYTVAYSAS